MLEPEVKGAAAAAPDGAEDRAKGPSRNSKRQLLVDIQRRAQDRAEREREYEPRRHERGGPDGFLRQF